MGFSSCLYRYARIVRLKSLENQILFGCTDGVAGAHMHRCGTAVGYTEGTVVGYNVRCSAGFS